MPCGIGKTCVTELRAIRGGSGCLPKPRHILGPRFVLQCHNPGVYVSVLAHFSFWLSGWAGTWATKRPLHPWVVLLVCPQGDCACRATSGSS